MKKSLLGILFLIILSVALIAGLNATPTTSNASIQTLTIPTPKPANLDTDKLWSLIQSWRQSEGLAPYIKDQRLCAIANDRVLDGFDNHKGFLDKMRSGYYKSVTPGTYVSENQGIDISEQTMLSGWLASPAHAAALRSPYKYSCVASKGNYSVQEFSNF